MARLGGLGSEAFSPPSGLGSILRDQKLLPGVRSSRSNVILGISRPPVAQSVSFSSSPKESFLLDVGTADDSDDLKEEDIWGMDDTVEDTDHGADFAIPEFSAADELSLGFSRRRKAEFAAEDVGFGIGYPRGEIREKVLATRRREKVSSITDGFGSNGSVGPSFLSRPSEKSPLTGRSHISQRTSASRMIPMSGGGKVSSRRHAEGQSAPVEVPKWSKMMGRSNKVCSIDDGEEDIKDNEDDRLPPHELVAKESARSQRTTFSVCEGLGRTLKGRDLSRVRNAVWSQMGFAD
ncbi:hypothetical protein KP509_18G028500 [Ceratopteris richardii]|uniref:Senescence regulator n=1 Tax=Ceratopteris richardii TaxID=49495 RepID=A0A8T2SSV0_CERRI|nr:hypothetical protein KP509_18G028500 [Ceratopteris richardii]